LPPRPGFAPTPAEPRERMSGNICHCGAYSNVIEAISDVAESAT
jgi:xanthine dehydrogenase YagT iron-sulfur-binding subunit